MLADTPRSVRIAALRVLPELFFELTDAVEDVIEMIEGAKRSYEK